MKQINIFIVLVFIAITSWITYRYVIDNNANTDHRGQIDDIRRLVKLNSMQITDEIIYQDTLDDIVAIISTDVNIIIGFNIEHLQWQYANDTLFVIMPQATIDKYQVGKERCLDAYKLNGTYEELLLTPTLSAKQSTQLRLNMSKHIDNEIIRNKYVEKARTQAMTNLAKLFAAFNQNVQIIDKPLDDDNINIPINYD